MRKLICWHEHHCLDSYLQQQISQSDWEIIDICVKKTIYCNWIHSGNAEQLCLYIYLFCVLAKQSTAAVAAPEKIEVFVNDKRVLVDPRITVLQVRFLITLEIFKSKWVCIVGYAYFLVCYVLLLFYCFCVKKR